MEQAIQQTGIRKGLTKLVIPIFIETLLIMMLGAVDTVMLSQYSDESVAAVGVVNQIVMFAFLIFEVINIGTSVLCSQYLGAGMRNKMVQVVGVSLLLNLVVGLVVSAILHYGAATLLGWMGLRPELLKYGIGYMEIVGAFAFFQARVQALKAVGAQDAAADVGVIEVTEPQLDERLGPTRQAHLLGLDQQALHRTHLDQLIPAVGLAGGHKAGRLAHRRRDDAHLPRNGRARGHDHLVLSDHGDGGT